jgi:DNA-binding NtrC family response regulator
LAASEILFVGSFPERDDLARGAEERGWTVLQVESGAKAFRMLQSKDDLEAVVLAKGVDDLPPESLLRRARTTGTRADFLIVGGERREDRASLLAEGAEEVFERPLDRERFLSKLELLRARRRLIDDLGLVVRNPAMLELFERILRVAPLKVTVLITGESGTGKEMLAQAIHRSSDRRDKPFVPVNVGALPENLVESELFGHERGAFTSADARRVGRFELANGGTLFLDEIGEMPLPAQVNLLRVLEDEQFLRVGGSQKISVDVRIVAATNRDLEEMVRQGKFRRDLYYRLKVVALDVPPLRQRREEIPIFARHIATQAAARHGVTFPGFTKEALDALVEYDWPGNVRELKNLVDGLVAFRPDRPITREDLPAHVLRGHVSERLLPALPRDRVEAEREFIIQSLLALRAEVGALRELILSRMLPGSEPSHYTGFPASGAAVYPASAVRVEEGSRGSLSLRDLERRTVERALRESRGNRRQAAEALGMSERTLYRRLKEFGLGEEEVSRVAE